MIGPGERHLFKLIFWVTVAVVAWGFTVIHMGAFFCFSLVTGRRFTDRLIPLVAKTWARVILGLIRVKVVFHNTEVFDERQARVVVVNHQSTLDLLWAARLAPSGSYGMGKKELLYVPFINMAWWSFGFLFIDRKNTERALRTMQGVAEKVRREKRSLFIAPEGTRTKSGEIGPFKKGAFRIALQDKLPIQPVIVAGAWELWPPGAWHPRKGTIHINCLPAIDTSNWNIDSLADHIEDVRAQMVAAYEQMRQQYVLPMPQPCPAIATG